MRTYVAKGAEAEALQTGANWYVVDATNAVLGRLATKVARMLIGKDKPTFTPYLDSGDHVVVINADCRRISCRRVGRRNCVCTAMRRAWRVTPGKSRRRSPCSRKRDSLFFRTLLFLIYVGPVQAFAGNQLRVERAEAWGVWPLDLAPLTGARCPEASSSLGHGS